MSILTYLNFKCKQIFISLKTCYEMRSCAWGGGLQCAYALAYKYAPPDKSGGQAPKDEILRLRSEWHMDEILRLATLAQKDKMVRWCNDGKQERKFCQKLIKNKFPKISTNYFILFVKMQLKCYNIRKNIKFI